MKANGGGAPPSPDFRTEEILNVNVGILGHVDSGKTSLVKTLSTLLSTAALDKSKQSRQRGMTLDLGFSCFFLDMPDHLAKLYPDKRQLQMTLVDCPGHASLIRTIIGGAQIINLVLLVVDAYKGWQAQTTECLVLAELTSPHLLIALNKIDMFPENEREAKIEEAKAKVRLHLAHSRFRDAPMVGVSACVGGEKVAATTGNSTLDLANNPTYNIDKLISTLQATLPAPEKQMLMDTSNKTNSSNSSSNNKPAFYFAIDHCFPIKGVGTVLTGTCLAGACKVNDTVEFPTLGLERKVKSIQMFKRKTTQIQKGDRAGICVSSLDSNLLERGMAATPGSVHLLKGAILLVKKIPYHSGKLNNGTKFHISVGHTTVMATVSFWGARELLAQQQQRQGQTKTFSGNANSSDEPTTSSTNTEQPNVNGSALGADADQAGLPYLQFDWDQDFLLQDGLLETLDATNEIGHDSNVMGEGSTTSSSSSSSEPLLHWALLDFQVPLHCPLNSLVIGSRLDTVENHNSAGNGPSASSCRLAFCGRLIDKMDPAKDKSRIRWCTPKERKGTVARLGDPHKRQDDGKIVRYELFGTDLFKKETVLKPFLGMKLVTPQGDIGELKSAFGTSGQFRVNFPAGTTAREGDALVIPFKRFQHDPDKKMRQDLQLPAARPGVRLEPAAKSGKHGKKNKEKIEATGEIERLKGDAMENQKYPQAIIAGFFTPEVNVRERIGQKVIIPSTREVGKIAGSFGKAGKCKVEFESGVSAQPGTKAELVAQSPSS